ncbi:TRAP transporter small permease [Pseudoruegeria sp. HB172150]|uniref:TRAP transporter small permease n=1 Tax=Pseudoruegeria sp. HB172150 TaxID=2721164 RepID=UPI0015565C98|nr:TRAP transporter small permease subunit [Pseudoruegeria sp. HB172150]
MRPLSRSFAAIALLGSVGLLAATLVTMLDVAGRIAGVTLMRGAIDIVGLSVVLAVALAVAECEWNDLHVRVEPLSAWMPRAWRRLADQAWRLVAVVVLGAIAWSSLKEGLLSHGYGEVLPALDLSLIWPAAIAAAGFAIGALAAALATLRRPRGADDGAGP